MVIMKNIYDLYLHIHIYILAGVVSGVCHSYNNLSDVSLTTENNENENITFEEENKAFEATIEEEKCPVTVQNKVFKSILSKFQ